jgi:hypothetical protein
MPTPARHAPRPRPKPRVPRDHPAHEGARRAVDLERALQRFRRRVQAAVDAFELELALPLKSGAASSSRQVSSRAAGTWDLSSRCLELQAKRDLSHGEIAEELGLDRSTVTNFLRLRRWLDPAILDAWRRGHPRAAQGILLRLVRLPHVKQLEGWRKLAH